MTERDFETWFDDFISEKQIDPDMPLNIEVGEQFHIMVVQNVIDLIKSSSKEDKKAIMKMLIRIDFFNQSVTDYFEFLVECFVKTNQAFFMSVQSNIVTTN